MQSAHLWITLWPFLLLLLWSLRLLILLIPSCLVVHRSMRLVFNANRRHSIARVVTQQSSVSALTSTELLKQLHWLPSEWQIRFKFASLVYKVLNTVLVTRHTLPGSYNITSPQGPRVHMPVTYCLFCDATFHYWHSCIAHRCVQNMELRTSSHPPIPNIFFLQTSS